MQNSDCRDAYSWGDKTWLFRRAKHSLRGAPLNIYEVHLGSWRRTGEGKPLSCREIAELLIPYVKKMGFTHVHLLPVAEHHPEDTWGYQCTDPFSVSSRYGTPPEFMYLVDELHKAGVGIFMDWVCPDLPEEALIECACFWLETYHLDGLRPVLFHGDRDVSLLQRLNETIRSRHPDICMIGSNGNSAAQGFTFSRIVPFSDPDVPFSEMTILSLSHDEVAHGKGSLLNQMPGTAPEKYAGVRAFYTCMLAMPGKKLTMMGSEFGQWNEWNSEHSLDWHLLDQQDEDGTRHRQLQVFFRSANALYLKNPALWQQDFAPNGFRWICKDKTERIFVFQRIDKRDQTLLIAVNFSPEFRENYRIGVPLPGRYAEVFHTDRTEFGGENRLPAPARSENIPWHGMEQSLAIDLPPLSAVILKCPRKSGKK